MLEPRRRLSLALAVCGALASARALAQNPPATVLIDAAADRRPINPEVYGVAFGSTGALGDLNVPVNRLGGNNTSRYNWQLNADNRGQDWFFESIPFAATPGEVGDTFISNSRAGGARAMLTIPTVGWVARLGPSRGKLASFSIAKYGAQTGNDWQWFPDAGNGIRVSGGFVTGNDPNDASAPADSLFQQGWAQHLVATWGTAAGGGLPYYILDNEPSIWHSTHRDVHPTGAMMQEIHDRTVEYAGRIKDVDPSALVVGPEEWGWSGYFYSGYDQQIANFSPGGPAQVWQLTSANVLARQSDAQVMGGRISASIPAPSVTLFVLPPASASSFYTLTPCRLIDTRGPAGVYGAPALAATSARSFVLSGRCGIPAGATAVAMNVTVTSATSSGFLTIWPGQTTSPPTTSALNFRGGQTRANNGIFRLAADGTLSIYAGLPSGSTDVVVDAIGYFQ